jgi:hypothetical protein
MINSSIAQENSITISGGYAFGNIKDVDENSTGWRINALYEYIGMNEHLSHGFSIGYIRTEGTFRDQIVGSAETTFKAGHWPIYYVPKYTFLDSESTFRPFVKGALGTHFSNYDRTGPFGGDLGTGDVGFYGGLGAGFNLNISELILINLEYEWAYLSNSWYRDGFMNSVLLGIGFKF